MTSCEVSVLPPPKGVPGTGSGTPSSRGTPTPSRRAGCRLPTSVTSPRSTRLSPPRRDSKHGRGGSDPPAHGSPGTLTSGPSTPEDVSLPLLVSRPQSQTETLGGVHPRELGVGSPGRTDREGWTREEGMDGTTTGCDPHPIHLSLER